MYSKKKIIDSRAEFEKLYNRSSRKEKPPKMVYEKACTLFNTIQETQVNRGQRRKGIQIACIWFKSKELGLSKDKNLIAKIHKIDLTVLNKGIDELEKYQANGDIDIPIFNVDEDIHSFIEQNFNQYNIPKQYIGFVHACVERAREKHISASSAPISKCVGAIYLLLKILGDVEKINQLSRECEISKPTYMRFYNNVMANLKKFKCVFKEFPQLKKLSYSKTKEI
jgi:transcription initiation factor TFIIIB Brf1 subunit/transcription initiation factor TFIIB